MSSHASMPRWAGLFLAAALSGTSAAPALGLQADQIALIVNSKVPEGRRLAEFYADLRHVPRSQIIEITRDVTDISRPDEEMGFDEYEPEIARAIRTELARRKLEQKVTCLVTFWGLPLRIAARVNTPDDLAEKARLEAELKDAVLPAVRDVTARAEAWAAQLAPDFHPVMGDDLDGLSRRAESALTAGARRLALEAPGPQRDEAFTQLRGLVGEMVGAMPAEIKLGSTPELLRLAPVAPPPERLAQAVQSIREVRNQLAALPPARSGSDARAQARQLVSQNLGLLERGRLLQFQIGLFETRETEAALDSELAMLWWRDYPTARWVINPLFFEAGKSSGGPATLMVMRLDGPNAQIVHDLIATSLKVEAEGLRGQVALDARGKPASDPYGSYDQTLRNLASLLKDKTKLQVTLDDNEAMFPPHSLKDVALYCGWYSPRQYVPEMQFNPGAVGFHVASFELVSLHTLNEKGWVRGLMSDGIAATLGPVAEPYLQSFPAADAFFPLLLTGKLTLAEVYWKTNPMASWMQTCIGDPLYNPYKAAPALAAADLPEPLRSALEAASSPAAP